MDTQRLKVGFGWGVVAVLAMSVPMIIGMKTGIAPMPKPIPIAIVAKILGGGPKTLLMVLGFSSHLLYGGLAGAVLAHLTRPVTILKGIYLALVLWLLMQVLVLPYLGWGAFGSAITPKIAVATLVLHLIYGIVLGWLMDRTPTTDGEVPRTV